MPQIAFKGKTYNSLDEMPDQEREAYLTIMALFKDANQNGIPNLFEGDLRKNILTALATSFRVAGNNQVYMAENMPPAMREKYEKAMAKLQQLGLAQPGPQVNEDISFSTKSPTPSAAHPLQSPELIPSSPIPQSPSAIQEDSGPNIAVVIVGVVILLLLLAAGAVVWIMLMNR